MTDYMEKSILNRLKDYVNVFIDRLSKQKNLTNPNLSCHRILLFGNDSKNLNSIEFLFSQYLSALNQHDVHLIRSSYLPDLIDSKDISFFVSPSIESALNLSFIKIYYLQDYRNLIKHLIDISVDNKKQMLPIAILIDDVYSYLLNEREVSQEIETESSQPKRKRFKKNTVHNDDDLQILMRICCFLIETIEYCSLKLNRNTYLIIKIDLNHFYVDDLEKQRLFLQKLTTRYFSNEINVDQI